MNGGTDDKSGSTEPAARMPDPSMSELAPAVFDEIEAAFDTPLIDPWSEPDECSIDTVSGCMPGLEEFKQLPSIESTPQTPDKYKPPKFVERDPIDVEDRSVLMKVRRSCTRNSCQTPIDC